MVLPIGDGNDSISESANIYSGFIDVNGTNGWNDLTPVIATGTTTTTLLGTCGQPADPSYTNRFIDLYEADGTAGAPTQGKRWIAGFQDNSKADLNPAGGAFTFNTAGLGITSGMKLVITVTYTKDTRPLMQSVSRAGNQSSVTVTGGTGMGPKITYGIQSSSSAGGTYSYIAGAVGGSGTFTDNSTVSFYKATGPSATGMTSMFSSPFTVP